MPNHGLHTPVCSGSCPPSPSCRVPWPLFPHCAPSSLPPRTLFPEIRWLSPFQHSSLSSDITSSKRTSVISLTKAHHSLFSCLGEKCSSLSVDCWLPASTPLECKLHRGQAFYGLFPQFLDQGQAHVFDDQQVFVEWRAKRLSEGPSSLQVTLNHVQLEAARQERSWGKTGFLANMNGSPFWFWSDECTLPNKFPTLPPLIFSSPAPSLATPSFQPQDSILESLLFDYSSPPTSFSLHALNTIYPGDGLQT